MSKTGIIKKAGIIVIFLMLILVWGCVGNIQRDYVPVMHPEDVSGGPADCLECHDNETGPALKPYATFVHTAAFLRQHGFYSSQNQDLCTSCHKVSFCQDCHATDDELRPSVKSGNRPDRTFPHRGDYIIQHRIDGRLDPGSCVSCHARRNSSTCLSCHNP